MFCAAAKLPRARRYMRFIVRACREGVDEIDALVLRMPQGSIGEPRTEELPSASSNASSGPEFYLEIYQPPPRYQLTLQPQKNSSLFARRYLAVAAAAAAAARSASSARMDE